MNNKLSYSSCAWIDKNLYRFKHE